MNLDSTLLIFTAGYITRILIAAAIDAYQEYKKGERDESLLYHKILLEPNKGGEKMIKRITIVQCNQAYTCAKVQSELYLDCHHRIPHVKLERGDATGDFSDCTSDCVALNPPGKCEFLAHMDIELPGGYNPPIQTLALEYIPMFRPLDI